MAKIKTSTIKKEKEKASFIQVLTGIWVVAILCILPLYFQDAYADILTAKYGFILVVDIALVVGFILWAIFGKKIKPYFQKMKTYADPDTGKWFGNWFKANFNILDIFVLAFLIITIISTLCAHPYIYQAFFGNEGRWNGALVFMLYAITYFIVSRNFKFSKNYINWSLIAFTIMCLWAISDYFDMDILRFKYYMSQEHYNIFVSTIGNIDSYTGVAAIPFALAGSLFILDDKKVLSHITYAICFAIVIISMITSAADNAYLSFFAFWAFIPLFAFKTRRGIRRYVISLAILVSSIELVKYWNIAYAETAIIPDGVVSILQNVHQLTYVMIGLWVLAILMYVYDLCIKKVPHDALAPKCIRWIWAALLVIGFLAFIVIFINANKAEPNIPAFLEPAREYLVFDPHWGTWRGYVWMRLMDIYNDLPFIHKVIGTGPETVSIYMYNEAYYDIADVTGMLYDCPHNEELQFLFDMGILGLISYIGVLVSPIILAAKTTSIKAYPYIIAVGFVGLTHIFESFVNIVIPVELTIIFALMAIVTVLYRNHNKEINI